MVGGKLGLPGEEQIMNHSCNIKALESALRRANDLLRWLNTLGQWNLIFDRYMTMVVACKMFTLTQMLGYRATIHRLAEKLRLEGRHKRITGALPTFNHNAKDISGASFLKW